MNRATIAVVGATGLVALGTISLQDAYRAMATTLAGNFTLLGSVANLIVAESAGRRGVRLSFGEFLKAGPLITVLTLGWGMLWLAWVT